MYGSQESVSEYLLNLNAMDSTSVYPVAVVPLVFDKASKHKRNIQRSKINELFSCFLQENKISSFQL